MNKASPLILKLPERALAPKESFLLDIKEVEAWVANLPMANTGESSKRIFKALVEFNRIEIPNIKRIKIARLFRPQVKYVASSLKKYYLDSSLPLPAKNQKVVVLCRELHSELANSYKIIIERMASGQDEKFERKLMVIALHQAIYYLSKVLYYSAIVYNPYPGNIWREIHQLFLFAEQNNIAKIKIGEGSSNNGIASTIEDIYKRTILLALASPFRLRQQEIEHLYHQLPGWTGHIRIFKPQSEERGEGQFFIRTESDEPPVHISLQPKDMGGRYRLVDVQQLVQHLRNELKAIFSEKSESTIFTKEMQITAPLLRKVINSLTYAPKRGFIRTKLNFELDIAVGISDVHFQIVTNKIKNHENENSDSAKNTQDDEDVLKDSSFLDSYFSADGDGPQIVPLDYPADEIIQYPRSTQDTWIEDIGAPSWATQIQEKESETFSCKTFNESAGGYCINWTGDNPPKIRVGELIGIQSASDHSQFSIGVARWLKHMPGIGLQLGMEIISPTAAAIKVHIAGNENRSHSTHKCVLLPKLTASNRPSCLILPVLNVQVGDRIQIDDGVEERPAKLVRLLESTGTFNQFEYTYLDTDGHSEISG